MEKNISGTTHPTENPPNRPEDPPENTPKPHRNPTEPPTETPPKRHRNPPEPSLNPGRKPTEKPHLEELRAVLWQSHGLHGCRDHQARAHSSSLRTRFVAGEFGGSFWVQVHRLQESSYKRLGSLSVTSFIGQSRKSSTFNRHSHQLACNLQLTSLHKKRHTKPQTQTIHRKKQTRPLEDIHPTGKSRTSPPRGSLARTSSRYTP